MADTQRRRIAHDRVHLITLEHADPQRHLHWRLGCRDHRFEQLDPRAAPANLAQARAPLAPFAIEHDDVSAHAESQHVPQMVRFVLGQRYRGDARAHGGGEETRSGHRSILLSGALPITSSPMPGRQDAGHAWDDLRMTSRRVA